METRGLDKKGLREKTPHASRCLQHAKGKWEGRPQKGVRDQACFVGDVKETVDAFHPVFSNLL